MSFQTENIRESYPRIIRYMTYSADVNSIHKDLQSLDWIYDNGWQYAGQHWGAYVPKIQKGKNQGIVLLQGEFIENAWQIVVLDYSKSSANPTLITKAQLQETRDLKKTLEEILAYSNKRDL